MILTVMLMLMMMILQKWTVGRVIDYVADCAGLHNPNNTGAAMVSLTASVVIHSVCACQLDTACSVKTRLGMFQF